MYQVFLYMRDPANASELDSNHYAFPLPISPVLVTNLVKLANAYAVAANVKLSTVGTKSTSTASLYVDLESGLTSCTLRKYDLLTAWFEENWPEDHLMPTLQDPHHYSPHLFSEGKGIPYVEKAIPRKTEGGQKTSATKSKKASSRKSGSSSKARRRA